MKGSTGFIERCAPYILSGIRLRPGGRAVIGSTGASAAQSTVGTPSAAARMCAQVVCAHLQCPPRTGERPLGAPCSPRCRLMLWLLTSSPFDVSQSRTSCRARASATFQASTHAAARRTAVRTLGRHALWFDARMRSSIGRCNTTCRRAISTATKTATGGRRANELHQPTAPARSRSARRARAAAQRPTCACLRPLHSAADWAARKASTAHCLYAPGVARRSLAHAAPKQPSQKSASDLH